VRFSNGRLQRPDSLRFTAFRDRDRAHPRKKHRRILVSETERLSYVGDNFSGGVMKCNSLCRYFVGVLNKDSGQMEVYDAEMFNMQPLLSGRRVLCSVTAAEFIPSAWRKGIPCPLLPRPCVMWKTGKRKQGDTGECGCGVCLSLSAERVQFWLVSLTQMDLCIEAFGTSKQKRALSARRMNTVANDVLTTAVTKAAANVIDTKGVTALIQDVAQEDVQNISVLLPPCNEDADKPQDVYKFEDILSPAEYEALRVPAMVFVNITPEEIAKRTEDKSHCSFVLEELKDLPAQEKSRDHKARCLWFLDTLVKFSYMKVIKKKNPMGPECPHIISKKLMKDFTSLTYNNGSVQNLVSASMKAKIAAYILALALHISDFQTDLTVLQNDLKLHESRMMDIAKAMRLKVSKAKGLPGHENDQNHKLGTLSLPLPVQKAAVSQRKRKKM
ncbi:RPA49 polymerase, partial [Rhinopomastus cyanomelas]|nr:RPA49 polymerase [Rhinopomastus cyanomelas]